MKVSQMRFQRLIRFFSGLATDQIDERTHGPIEYDVESQTITVRGECIPVEGNVMVYVPLPDAFRCEDCGEEFENSQGIGGHRASKHKGKKEKGA